MIYSRGGIPAPPCESPRRPRGRGDRDNRSVGPFGPEEFFYHETSKLPRLPQASAPPSARGNQGRAPWRSRSGTRTVTTRQASGSRTVTTRQPHGWYPATEPHPHSCAFPVPLRAGSRYGASMLQERRPDARLWREELRAMVALAWPLVLTNVTSTLISSTDVVLLGWAGSRTLAAGTLGMNLYVAFLIFGMGLVTAAAPMIAKELGERRHSVRDVRRTVRQAMWSAVAMCVPVWIVLWNTRAILLPLGQEPALAAGAQHLVRAIMWAMLPSLFYLILRSFVSALERPVWSLVIGLSGVVFNAFLNYGLILGHWGFPALGLTGAGIGSSCAN